MLPFLPGLLNALLLRVALRGLGLALSGNPSLHFRSPEALQSGAFHAAGSRPGPTSSLHPSRESLLSVIRYR